MGACLKWAHGASGMLAAASCTGAHVCVYSVQFLKLHMTVHFSFYIFYFVQVYFKKKKALLQKPNWYSVPLGPSAPSEEAVL